MKNLLRAALLSFVLLLASPGVTAVNTDSFSHKPTQVQQTLCYASTQCSSGVNVWCKTYGAGCTWQVYPWVGVRCTGYDLAGDWVVLEETCQ